MNIRAILLAVLIASALAGGLIALAVALEVSLLSAPQLLTLFALWLVPGYIAGKRAADAGTLHGLLSGLLGMPLIWSGWAFIASLSGVPARADLVGQSPLIPTLLAGFWASLGGMLADVVRLIRAKRAARKSAGGTSGSRP